MTEIRANDMTDDWGAPPLTEAQLREIFHIPSEVEVSPSFYGWFSWPLASSVAETWYVMHSPHLAKWRLDRGYDTLVLAGVVEELFYHYVAYKLEHGLV